MVQGDTTDNAEQDEDDLSEYRKSLITYADLNYKANEVSPRISRSPLVKKLSATDSPHFSGEFDKSTK